MRTIEVTLEDIKNGKRLDPSNCPITLACKRAFPDAYSIRITGAYLTYSRGQVNYVLMSLPGWITEKVRYYDKTNLMEPFKFEFDLPYYFSQLQVNPQYRAHY